MQIRRQGCDCAHQIAKSLLLDGATDRHDPDRIGWVRPVPFWPWSRRVGKAGEVEAVIEQAHAPRGDGVEMPGASLPPGHAPTSLLHLLALFPVRDRPDVLSVRREAPCAPCEQ